MVQKVKPGVGLQKQPENKEIKGIKNNTEDKTSILKAMGARMFTTCCSFFGERNSTSNVQLSYAVLRRDNERREVMPLL